MPCTGARRPLGRTGSHMSARLLTPAEVNHYNAIQTGLLLTPATIGILAASVGADRFARRHPQRWLIVVGFLVTAPGMILLLVLVRAHAGIWRWIPGLLLFGVGIGDMLTASVNVVRSSFPDKDQGEISGLSRSVSNLGSSLGTALVGSVLVAAMLPEGKPFAVALTVMLAIALLVLVLAVLIPVRRSRLRQHQAQAPNLRHSGRPRDIGHSRYIVAGHVLPVLVGESGIAGTCTISPSALRIFGAEGARSIIDHQHR
jgi:MFS family permease